MPGGPKCLPGGLVHLINRDRGEQRPEAHDRNRSTDSAALTATGTTFWAAAVSGKSSNAANRQHARISAPVHWPSLGLA